MDPKIIFFGEADYGKSTIIGYLYAESLHIDMERVETRLKEKIGANYQPGYLYSSLINSDVVEGITKKDKVVKEIQNADNLVEGTKILKDSEDELITQTTSIIGTTAKIITTTHKRKFKRGLNSIVRHLRNIRINNFGDSVKITLIDTPGHAQLLSEREIGMAMSDIGVFCLAINEVLKDDFDGFMFKQTDLDLWAQYNYNRKLIYLLTKFDLVKYSEDDYKKACRRINQYCKQISVEYEDELYGTFLVEEADVAAIIPVAVEPGERTGANLLTHSDKTPWYKGLTLIEAIKEQMYELSNVYTERPADNLLFSVDKEIATPRSNVGKVWRIHIRNGWLNVGDQITLTNVNLDGHPGYEFFDVEATVKTIHEELAANERVADANYAYQGSIATIDLKSCYANGKRVDKKDVRATRQTVGFASGEPFKHYDKFSIKFVDATKAFDVIRVGQEALLLWYGKRVPAKIVGLSDSLDGMYVELLHGRKIAVPDDPAFRELDVMKSIKIFSHYERQGWHFSGLFAFDE